MTQDAWPAPGDALLDRDPQQAGDLTATGDPPSDEAVMQRAMALGAAVRGSTAPNPWVGAVVVPGAPARRGGTPEWFEGATAPPGGPHAEVRALTLAGQRAPDRVRGGTLYTTLEPCAHHGRTPPCVAAIVDAGIRRVVVGVCDPDPLVAGRGVAQLRQAGVEVRTGVCSSEVEASLAPYLKHRRTGHPWVVLKLAATLDGRIAAPDGSSQWITGELARRDAHLLRSRCDAILVGAGTLRADDPKLTARCDGRPLARQPLRVVLGSAPEDAAAQPVLSLSGELPSVLDALGRRGVLELLVEGGAGVAHDFHAAGLVDRYVVYLAPALFGGDDARPMFTGAGRGTVTDLWRGKLLSVEQLGQDLRLELAA